MPKSRLNLLVPLLLLSGCASTSGYQNPQDPFESMNRSIYKFNDALDRAVIKPVAKGYRAVLPRPGRTLVTNFFSNLDDVLVTLNDLLQFKFRHAASDFGRVLINTTVGALGLADAATAAGLKKHDEDFGQTLGYWGFSSGPYLMLPILGPSSVRDGIGLYVDSFPSMITQTRPIHVRNQAIILKGISNRSNLLEQEKLFNTAIIDRYSFIRDAYLQHRKSLVYDGNPPRPKYYEDDQ
jgi:phospholipid-binding lipoprotein MlaA